MRVTRRALRKTWTIAACLLLALEMGMAQKKPAANAPASTPNDTRRILVDKARALEARGRPDMAIQLWQQILLSDPNNVDALAGLAKDFKLIGSADKSNETLERLRRVNPKDPNIAKIAALSSTKAESDRLKQAGDLARQGKVEDAMRVYRELYGDRPPDGDIALAYYQTLYGTGSGKETAIAAMRALAQRNPGDPRFAVELGRMLTYDGKTRAEGIRILEEHPKDSVAQSALRQALIWDAANPSSAAELRNYLKDHPLDTEISGHLKENESKLAQMNSGIARTPAERAAFGALNARKLDTAQTLFTAILEMEPNNGRVAAGMGFLRMQQGNFGGAISYLTQAEQNGYKERAVEDALVASRFWYTMGEASQAFDENQLDVAMEKYRAALVIRPRSVEALNGLAGLLIKEQQFPAAAGVYEQLLKAQPGSSDAWRGLFLAYARDNQNQKAIAVSARFPAGVKAAMAKDPEYLRTLATIYHAENRTADAQRVLAQALALPFPDNGTTLKADTRQQYAGILMEAKRYDQAVELYTQILNDDAGNLYAWMGLVNAHHELNQDNLAIADVEKMPPATYETALSDPGFLSMLGAIYQQANQFEIAQGMLERSAKLQIAAGGQPSLALQLQLAAIYLERNNTEQAYGIYRQVLMAHPDRVDAWKGLIASLQVTNHTSEALQEIALIPPPVRKQLEMDIEFVQGEASLYAASGDIPHAVEYMNRVESYYIRSKTLAPASIEIQNAWLLFNTRNDRLLYPALMRLGTRQDLTATQRETVQTIWANWSVRRAGTAMDNGNLQRGSDILDAASQAFPDNLSVRKAVAGGYMKVGRARDSLAMFKTVPMQDASAGDFQAAIGAALAADDKAQAELWLRQALERFPADAGVLSLAARFEQARGNNQRAADFWKASLAAMPQVSPIQKLEHALVYPEEEKGIRRAATPADLHRLLDPDNEPFPKTTMLPPLPAYGTDPYQGTAPVVLPPANTTSRPGQAPQQGQWINAPTTTVIPVSPAPASNPPAPPIPKAQLALPNVQPESQPTGTQIQAAKPPASKPPHTAGKAKKSSGQPTGYTGKMNLPASEENINSTEPVSSGPQKPPPQQAPARSPESSLQPHEPNPASGLRITAQPMNSTAANAQALFAEQTDGQLTQGSANSIHTLANAQMKPALPPSPQPAGLGKYSTAQYTPSAQEAATGAYSAPKQQAQQAAQQPTALPPAQAADQPAAPGTEKKHKKGSSQAKTRTVPTLVTAPAGENPQQPQMPDVTPAPAPNATGTGLSDEELQQRNLPPLRGPWVRVQREQRTTSPRDEAEMQLRSIESGYSPWLGGTGLINYRSGDLGYDHLSALESPFEASMPLGYDARLTFIAKPVFLDSGQADGTSVITVLHAVSPGGPLVLTTIPQPIGTLTTTDVIRPAQQNATGIGGEVQLAGQNMSGAVGYTPSGFLVATITGRFQFKPGNGPFTFNFSRDPVKDTQLSYAGLRDPAGNTLGNAGPIWGGMIANLGNVQYAHGDAESGFYLAGGVQYITGYKVASNSRIEGSGGAYWRIRTIPESGNLSIGANFFAMHYAKNQDAFTFGMGGYFSPQAYFLANAPITWAGHSGTNWHYNILGSLGVQAFQIDKAALFPGAAITDYIPSKVSVGPNYDLRAQAAYQIGPHWFAGGFFGANNSRNYVSISAGFYVRYLFRTQPSTVAGPTGLFQMEGQHPPNDALRPFRVP